jgi:hypothetical protein
MTGAAILPGGDFVLRRAMFVLELIDPVAGVPAGAELEARAKGFGAPSVNRAGQFVWRDVDPPADRTVKVTATSRNGQFAPFEETFAIPRRTPTTPLTPVRRTLAPTGLYVPPPGRLAAAGMLIDDEAARTPLSGADVVLVLSESTLGMELRSSFVATTDPRGSFVTVAAGFGSETPKPAPRPAPDGTVAGRLEVSFQGFVRRTSGLLLRQSQLNYLPGPLVWVDLPP